jgi:hypothetical protein
MYDRDTEKPHERDPGPTAAPVNLKTPGAKRRELETEWSDAATTLLQRCAEAIDKSSHVGATVTLGEHTSEAAVKRVKIELERRGWVVKREKYSDPRESWDNLRITEPHVPDDRTYPSHMRR